MSDPVTTQYTHTLTVTERLGGEYKCHVDSFNHKTTSFFDLDAIHIEGMYIDLCDNAYVGLLFHSLHTVASPPYEVLAFQEGPTTVHVIWDHPDRLNETIGFQIYYTGPTNGSLASDDIVSNYYIITGLVNGGSYHISVAGKSLHLESAQSEAHNNPIGLSKFLVARTLTRA